jgi:hypothetical protein
MGTLMQPTETHPREGMMAVVRNRRAMITGVHPSSAEDGHRWHLVEVEYSDGLGAETDRLLWEIEPDTQVLEPSALPAVDRSPPMDPAEFDAMVRAARWSAHDGDGWMLPEALCLADLGLTRSVDGGVYDARARAPQPVRARMGPRFLDGQLAQSVEESWAECERHAKAMREGTAAPVSVSGAKPAQESPRLRQGSDCQPSLFGDDE